MGSAACRTHSRAAPTSLARLPRRLPAARSAGHPRRREKTINFGGTDESAYGAALQPDGRILVAGQRTGAEDFAVARLLG
jgi:hypothetical protein